MADTKTKPNLLELGDPSGFMAGVALFDELLREAERIGFSSDVAEANSISLAADGRLQSDGVTTHGPLNLFALPLLESLFRCPELARGFAGALGDYVGSVQQGVVPGRGDQYAHLSFEDCAARPRGGERI
jgi:hypothetical protein